MAAKAESLHSRKGTKLWTAAKLNIAFSCLTLRFLIFVQWQLLVAFRNIAYVTVVLVTFKFQQIVRSWYSVQVTFVCTALWTTYLRSNLSNVFKIRRVLRKLWRNTFWCVFMPHSVLRIRDLKLGLRLRIPGTKCIRWKLSTKETKCTSVGLGWSASTEAATCMLRKICPECYQFHRPQACKNWMLKSHTVWSLKGGV